MGKRLIIQRRGAAKPPYLVPSHRHKGKCHYPSFRIEGSAFVEEIIHDPGHSAPVAVLRIPGGEREHVLATEGIFVGKEIALGGTTLEPGNILKLKDIPEGSPIHTVEARPGDGGKFIRSAGTFGTVVGRTPQGVVVRLPSGQFKTLSPDCRATIGVVAGGGRGEKPIAKAGKAYWMYRSKGKVWPRVRGVAKNPVDHPHGGGNAHRKEGKPTTIPRGAPPGRKVGHIAARRTGLRKG